MGIYTNGSIFGIKITSNTIDGINILYEKQYNTIMNREQIQDVYLFYMTLIQNHNPDGIKLEGYMEYSSTYENGTFMMWSPITIEMLVKQNK